MPKIQYDTVDLGDGYEAQVKFLLPATYESASTTESYPLVLKVYSGPGSQLVLDAWTVSFDTYLVSSRNYIVAYIDGRGSGNRGSKYTEPLYRRFGTVEVSDQITAIKMLSNVTNSIRRDSVAVWGWSYGGFVAAHIVKQDRFKTFKCAASVAPVTNFLYYDAAYTERFMGLNKTGDNYDGYQKTIVNRDVSAFGLGKFLLAHGTGDDNVHFQNSAMLVEALAAKGVQFQFMAYTNQQHSISDNTFHLYTMLDNFFVNCFHTPIVRTNTDDN
uniref:Peptidase S9 prolyl oligopeptidase catalytic domain-containing protein n=1 Tax=Romanomermis culicivorax TaxID=13658 RepID=A0A915KDE9_ROMCU